MYVISSISNEFKHLRKLKTLNITLIKIIKVKKIERKRSNCVYQINLEFSVYRYMYIQRIQLSLNVIVFLTDIIFD